MNPVPETYSQQDWPRKVAGTVRAIINAVKTLQTGLVTAQSDITAAEGDITALQADVTAAEADIAALETATNWAALADFADDTAAAAGGVAVGKLYRTGSAVKVRVA